MAPRIGECLPEILELKVALVLVKFEPMVVVVPFLVESELFHGGVVEDRWLSMASRAHRLNQGLATADCVAAAVAAVLPRAFQVLAGPGAARAPRSGGGRWRPERRAAEAGAPRSGAAAAGGRTPAPSGCLRGPQRLPALPSTPEDKVER